MAVQLGRLEIETSDHVILRYDLAGGGNRGFAALVDFIIASIIFVGALFVMQQAVNLFGAGALTLSGVLVLVTFFITWCYFVLLEWLWQGQTVGKRMYGLRVIGEDGSPATFTAVLVRNLARMIDFLPGFYAVGLLTVIVTPRSQRLGDLAAGTYVVRAPKPQLDYFSLRTMSPVGQGTSVETRTMPGEVQRLVREFVSREAKLKDRDRARIAAQIASRVRPYALDVTVADDAEFLRAVARSLRASGGDR
jgi:uncharacterized RDD family membrane protein YckC